ncbi:MAG: glycosyltransferase family 2 protein [Candidatus Aenigmatarchaeota archaeon]
MTKLVVMIPAYNEEKTIASVIREIPRKIEGISKVEILVINDGSTDKTVEVARKAGADRIVSNRKNMGLGFSFKKGLNEALNMDADVVVNIDADGQYNAKEIAKLVRPIIDGKADIVLGWRDIDKLDHMPLQKKIGNKIATFFTRLMSGLPIKDAQTGFRALSSDAVMKLNLFGRYTYVQETLIQAKHKGLVIEQVPVEFRKREGKSRLIANIFKYARMAGLTMIRSMRDYDPLKVFLPISFVFFLLSALVAIPVLQHYFATGLFTGYTGRGLLSAMFFITGVIVFTFGLLADMLRTQRDLQEEIIYMMRKRSK